MNNSPVSSLIEAVRPLSHAVHDIRNVARELATQLSQRYPCDYVTPQTAETTDGEQVEVEPERFRERPLACEYPGQEPTGRCEYGGADLDGHGDPDLYAQWQRREIGLPYLLDRLERALADFAEHCRKATRALDALPPDYFGDESLPLLDRQATRFRKALLEIKRPLVDPLRFSAQQGSAENAVVNQIKRGWHHQTWGGQSAQALQEMFSILELVGEANDEPSMGVSLFDLAFVMEQDETAATKSVKTWSDSKRITAKPIGKCPLDGRRELYGLSEILSDVAGILSLDKKEQSKYRQALTAKLRCPRNE